MRQQLAGLAVIFLGLALGFAALSCAAPGRGVTAALAVRAGVSVALLAGLIVALLGRRLLVAARRADAA